MAADELLLEQAWRREEAVLRLYRWIRPAWSLGRTQAYEGSVDETFCRSKGIDIVRRPTGGWALLHDRELTYALAAPSTEGAFAGSVLETYRKISGVLAGGLERLGAAVAVSSRDSRRPTGPLCFSATSAHEIVVSGGGSAGAKLVGSSQRRRRSAFLQHGSIPLEIDPELQAGAAGLAGAPEGLHPADLSGACGRRIGFDEAAAAVVDSFASHPGVWLFEGGWTEAERAEIERLRAERYMSVPWTRGRRRGGAIDPAWSTWT